MCNICAAHQLKRGEQGAFLKLTGGACTYTSVLLRLQFCSPKDTCILMARARCSGLIYFQGKDVPSTKDVEELAVLAGKTLLRRYGDEAPDRVPLVLATLKAQGFAES